MITPDSFVQSALRCIGVGGWQACALVGFAFAGGLAVWLFGERVFRPTATVIMGFLGTLVGAAASPLLWGGTASPFQVLLSSIGGLVIGGVMGMIAYRWALACGTGCLFASAGPMAVCVVLGASGPALDGNDDWPEETARAPMRADSWASGSSVKDENGSSAVLAGAVSEFAGQMWSRVGPLLAGVEGSPIADVRAQWGRRTQTQQGLIAAVAVIGMAAGIALGLVRPRWAGVLLTSAVGAALWVPSLAWLSGALNAPWVPVLERLVSLGAPIGVGAVVLGAILQARGMASRSAA